MQKIHLQAIGAVLGYSPKLHPLPAYKKYSGPSWRPGCQNANNTIDYEHQPHMLSCIQTQHSQHAVD